MPPMSLRAHLVIGAAFWTVGLAGLAIVVWHVALGHREPPASFVSVLEHPHLVGLVCLAAVAGGAMQVRRGWQSVNQIRTRLAGMHERPHGRLTGRYPAEVAPLVADVNRLLDERDAIVDRARAAAGDLAHGLKTPLAVLTQEAERAAQRGHPVLAGSIHEQVERMRKQVEYQLGRSRVDASKQGPATPVAVRDSAEAIVRTVQRLYADRHLSINAEVAGSMIVLIHREDLDEILGNVIDNACKWAKARCLLTVAARANRVVLVIDDDGPGIVAAMRERVLRRGVRADEAVPGSGLGLSIVRDLVEAHGGAIVLDESPLGGLRVTLDLPAATART